MKRFTITTVAVLVIVLAGCTSSPEKRSAEPSGKLVADSDPADRDVVIGYLEKREWVITIKAGPHGPIYSVATKAGRILHEDLSAEQLKARLPELHELIKTGVAGDGSMRSSKFDASVQR